MNTTLKYLLFWAYPLYIIDDEGGSSDEETPDDEGTSSDDSEVLHEGNKERNKEISKLESKIDELKDFVIWMTGCGYDFCQHEYFCDQRDKLLKDTPLTGEQA